MKILIFTAHPGADGFTHKIARKYRQGAAKAGHRAEIYDLYDPRYKQDYFSFNNPKFPKPDSLRDFFQDKISGADELVFIHPLWWMSMPAVMKNFLDSNFTPGFAYKYKSMPILKGRPVGQLKGKQARVFITADAPNWLYKLMFSPFKLVWKHFTLRLWGIKTKSFVVFDRMRWRSKEKKEKWLEKVYRMARGV